VSGDCSNGDGAEMGAPVDDDDQSDMAEPLLEAP
jgi:hypothetical protein